MLFKHIVCVINNIYISMNRAADEGRKPRVADFGDKVEDSTFLNQLQNGVNRWIKEIQKVGFRLFLICMCLFKSRLISNRF